MSQAGDRNVVRLQGMAREKGRRIGAGTYAVRDDQSQYVSQIVDSRRQEIVRLLVQEGWTNDSADRRMLVDMMYAERWGRRST
jgi:hypothetical protein